MTVYNAITTWLGLGTRLLLRTGSFPSPTYPLLIAPVSPTSRGCGLWWTPPTT